MWAITTKGAGRPVGARQVKLDWPLQQGESFKVNDDGYHPDMVLAEDGLSLRQPTAADLAKQAQDRKAAEAASVFESGIGASLLDELWSLRSDAGQTRGLTKDEFKAAMIQRYTRSR